MADRRIRHRDQTMDEQTDNSTPDGRSAPTRERILDSAQRLFSRQGFTRTTTAAIAKEAGVAAGLVFYYFSSKRELFDALMVERTFAPELQQIVDAADPNDPHGTLLMVGHRFLGLLRDREEFGRILFQSVSARERLARLAHHLESELHGLASYLRTALGHELDESHAVVMARMLLSTIMVGVFFAPPAGDLEVLVRHTVDVLLQGYQPRIPA
jgi:AcrR family transcriptional regulator